MYIGGRWRPGGAGTGLATSPSSGETFAPWPSPTPLTWTTRWRGGRGLAGLGGRVGLRAGGLVRAGGRGDPARRDELAQVLTQDQGKPLAAEAYDEVDELAGYFLMAGRRRAAPEGRCPRPPRPAAGCSTGRVPLGVVGVISPWNWPYTMGAELFAPALAAGNAVVWVPAPSTSACCAVLAEIIAGSGIPDGVFSFLPGPGPVAGDALAGHPGVAASASSGRWPPARLVAARAAGKTQLLELGGNGPMVILEDADLELAAEAALEAAYLCAGQSCTAGERFLVHAAVRAEFTERVVAATEAAGPAGRPVRPGDHDGAAEQRADRGQVRPARGRRGRPGRAAVLRRPSRGRASRPSCTPSRPCWTGSPWTWRSPREETFGPVVPVIEVASADEALDLTNALPVRPDRRGVHRATWSAAWPSPSRPGPAGSTSTPPPTCGSPTCRSAAGPAR